MEEEDDLFSFQGRIGLRRFYTVVIAASLVGFAVDSFLPVSHEIITFGPSSISYATSDNWLTLLLNYALQAPLLWIMVAAIVKRLHALDISGKWFAAFPALIISSGLLHVSLSSLGMQKTTVDLVTILLVLPFLLVCIWFGFQILFLPLETHEPIKTRHFDS